VFRRRAARCRRSATLAIAVLKEVASFSMSLRATGSDERVTRGWRPRVLDVRPGAVEDVEKRSALFLTRHSGESRGNIAAPSAGCALTSGVCT